MKFYYILFMKYIIELFMKGLWYDYDGIMMDYEGEDVMTL